MAVSPEDALVCRVFFAVLSVINIIGNALVILSVLRNRWMHTIMNYLLVNLAIADILVGLFLLPRYVFNQLIEFPGDVRADINCKFFTYGAISWVGLHAQVFTLIVISFERYSAVVHPHRLRNRLTKRKLKIVLVACWVYAILFNMPSFMLLEYSYAKKECVKEWSALAQKIWSFLWLITCGPIPLVTMGYLYGKVVYDLWFKKKGAHADMSRIAVNKSRKRVTKMVITIAIIYAICWLPNLIVFNILEYFDNIPSLDLLYMLSHLFLLLNSTVNPFVYSIQSRRFRKAMLRTLCFWKPRNFVMSKVNSISCIAHVRKDMLRNYKSHHATEMKGSEASEASGTPDCYTHVRSERFDSNSHATSRKGSEAGGTTECYTLVRSEVMIGSWACAGDSAAKYVHVRSEGRDNSNSHITKIEIREANSTAESSTADDTSSHTTMTKRRETTC
jgi:hypothetical protein